MAKQSKNKAKLSKNVLMNEGGDGLGEVDFLALLIGAKDPITQKTPYELAKALLEKFGSLHEIDLATFRKLAGMQGIGEAKALRIKAAIALAQHLKTEQARAVKFGRIRHANDVVTLTKMMTQKEKKSLLAFFLSDGGDLLGYEILPSYPNHQQDNAQKTMEGIQNRYPDIDAIVFAVHVAKRDWVSFERYQAVNAYRQSADEHDIEILDFLAIHPNGYESLLSLFSPDEESVTHDVGPIPPESSQNRKAHDLQKRPKERCECGLSIEGHPQSDECEYCAPILLAKERQNLFWIDLGDDKNGGDKLH